MVTYIDPLLTQLKAYGFFELVLPFLLTFTIIYGIFQSSKLLGENKKSQGVISFVVALFVMFSPAGPRLAAFFSVFFTSVSVVLIATIFIGILMMMIWRIKNPDKDNPKVPKWAFWIGAFVVLMVFAYSGGLTLLFPEGSEPGIRLSSGDIWIIGIIGFILIIVLAAISMYLSNEKDKQKARLFEKNLEKLLSGGHGH